MQNADVFGSFFLVSCHNDNQEVCQVFLFGTFCVFNQILVCQVSLGFCEYNFRRENLIAVFFFCDEKLKPLPRYFPFVRNSDLLNHGEFGHEVADE